MNSSLKLLGLLPALAAVCSAEWQAGRGAVTLEAALSAAFDSNLYASAREVSDYYLTFEPVVRYREPTARFVTNGSAGVRIRRHLDETFSNSEDADVRLNWAMAREGGHTTGAALDLAYFETSDAVFDVNQRVRARHFHASGSGEVLVARRNLLSAGFTHREGDRDIGSDQRSRSGRVGYSYVGFPDESTLGFSYLHQHNRSTDTFSGARQIDQTVRTVSATYSRPLYAEATAALTYGYRWLDRGSTEAAFALPDRQGSFVSFSLGGPFLPARYFPKTSSTFRLAYEQAEVPGMNDRSNERLVGQLDVTWQARERTSVTLSARRAQELSITDNTVINAGGGVTVRQAVGNFIQAEMHLAYTNAEFIGWGRTDDRYEARVSGQYAINRRWSSSLAYSYLDSESTSPIADFDRHVVNLTATYAF